MNVKSSSINKITWIVVLVLIVAVAIFERVKVKNRIENADYAIGQVIGIDEDAKGSRYVVYTFFVDKIEYKGSVNTNFCKKCNYKCCVKGGTVKVRYDKRNPQNNDLIQGDLSN